MKEFKGTPAPWIAGTDENEISLEQIIIYSDNGIQPHVCYTPEFSQNDKTAQANAKLIAAAPELLEALQLFMAAWQADGNDDFNNVDVVAKAHAAITKALS